MKGQEQPGANLTARRADLISDLDPLLDPCGRFPRTVRRSRRDRPFAQAYRLQGLSPLDPLGQGKTYLGQEALPILGIPESLRCKFRGPQT